MNRALIVSLVSALLCTAVAFAQPADPTDLADPIAAPAGVEARSEEDIARRSKVYATIGEATITVGEIEDAINAQSPFLRVRYREPAKMQELAENLIRFELLAAEAERRGYGEHAAVVRSVGQNAVQQLIRREFDQRITPDSIPEEDVRAYYAAHREEFARPEMVRASHILLGSEEEAQQVLTKVREADARTFRQLAREQSVDTETKLRGGDLRFFTREGRPPGSRDAAVDATIVEAAFAIAEVGQVGAAPVQVGEHWSVIKLTGRRPAEERAFEESARGIRLRLWRERRQAAIETFVDDLRQTHQPVVHMDRLGPIRLDPVEPASSFPAGHGQEPAQPTKAGVTKAALQPAEGAAEAAEPAEGE